MVSHAEVIKAFLEGKKATGFHMKSVVRDDITLLIGYDWALYAMRVGGTTIVFAGWRDYSRTSSGHIAMIPVIEEQDIVVYDRVEPSDAHKYYDLPNMGDWDLPKYDAARVGRRYVIEGLTWQFYPWMCELSFMNNSVVFWESDHIETLMEVLRNPVADKIDYLKYLAASRLTTAGKHLDFNWERLKKAVHLSRAFRGLTCMFARRIIDRGYLVQHTIDGGALIHTRGRITFMITRDGRVLVDKSDTWGEWRRKFVSREERPRWEFSDAEYLTQMLGDCFQEVLYKLPEAARSALIAHMM